MHGKLTGWNYATIKTAMNETSAPRNIEAQKKHRREVFWQIVVPMIVGGLCVASMVTLVIINDLNGGSNSQAADTSLIYMILPTMFCAIVPFIVFAGVAFGLTRAIKGIPPYAKQVQDAIKRAHAQIRRASNRITDPLIKMNSRGAGFKAIFRRKDQE